MADIRNYLENFRIEKFKKFKLNNHLSKFEINQNMVIFFDLENNKKTDLYIKDHLEILQKKFKTVGKNFIYILNLNQTKDIETILKFYFPFLSINDLQQFTTNSCFYEYQNILDYIGYEGNIKCGFLFFDNYTTSILECNDIILNDCQEIFFNDLIAFFTKTIKAFEEYEEIEEHDDLPCQIDNLYENLDDDTKKRIQEIQNQLAVLKNSGQFLFALPILKDILHNEANAINLNDISIIRIGSDNKIILPDFNNLEIQLSHLTKAVYILFYNHPQGINIKELHEYKNELLDLYSKISNQMDYDKMKLSIDDLVNPESKAIYTHISRIKSAFYKQMDSIYAKNYIVDGGFHGSDIKYISILKQNFDLDDGSFKVANLQY